MNIIAHDLTNPTREKGAETPGTNAEAGCPATPLPHFAASVTEPPCTYKVSIMIPNSKNYYMEIPEWWLAWGKLLGRRGTQGKEPIPGGNEGHVALEEKRQTASLIIRKTWRLKTSLSFCKSRNEAVERQKKTITTTIPRQVVFIRKSLLSNTGDKTESSTLGADPGSP